MDINNIFIYYQSKFTNYGYTERYKKFKNGKIQKVGDLNKIQIDDNSKFISILEIFSILNNPTPLRLI